MPKERLVSFDDNVMIDLSLVPQPTSAPAAHAAASAERAPSRRESSRHGEAPARHEPPPPPLRPAAIVSAPPPPAAVAAPERKRPNDIVPRGEWEPPRKRAIDTSNPYGDEK